MACGSCWTTHTTPTASVACCTSCLGVGPPRGRPRTARAFVGRARRSVSFAGKPVIRSRFLESQLRKRNGRRVVGRDGYVSDGRPLHSLISRLACSCIGVVVV